MKIVVLASYAPSLINFRGCLIEDMVAAGHTVVACAPDPDPRVIAALAERGARYEPVPLDRTGLNPVRDAATMVGLVRVLRRLRPDLLLAYTPKPVIYGALAARLAGVPRVYALITGLGYAFSDGSGAKRRALRLVVTSLYRRSLRFTEGVFFQNPDDLADFQALGVIRNGQRAIRVNGSGVDTEHFTVSPPPLEPPTFLLIARLLRDKGIPDYVAAARLVRERHPAARFRLVGPFDSNPTAVSTAEVERWQAEGTIEYLGATDDVRPWLAECTVYVLPSLYREGLPRTVLEAMATGRAIVTTDVPGCRETVVPGENGFLVPPGDPAALAAAIERFCEQPDLAVAFGRRSRKIVEARFDVRKVNAVMLDAMGLAPGSSAAEGVGETDEAVGHHVEGVLGA